MEAGITALQKVSIAGRPAPRWAALAITVALVLAAFFIIVNILLGQVDAISKAWPRYLERFQDIAANLVKWAGPEAAENLRTAIAEINLGQLLPRVAGPTGSFFSTVLLVALYVGFLLSEQKHFNSRIAALWIKHRNAHDIEEILKAISSKMRRYIWVTTAMGILEGLCSYAILRYLGIDFAETWALLIVLLSFIPNIGAMFGIVFPALLALVQFDTYWPFVAVVVGLTFVQVAVGNVLGPIVMGRTLNISSFAVVVLLALWGTIWGVVGMILSIPIAVIFMIASAHLPNWRWVAVLLSADGEVVDFVTSNDHEEPCDSTA